MTQDSLRSLVKSAKSNDLRAVSPVISVILVTAITVILAAVIGTFVLGLSDSVNSQGPQVATSIQDAENTVSQVPRIEYTGEGGNLVDVVGDGQDYVRIEHRGGEVVPMNDLEIQVVGQDTNQRYLQLNATNGFTRDDIRYSSVDDIDGYRRIGHLAVATLLNGDSEFSAEDAEFGAGDVLVLSEDGWNYDPQPDNDSAFFEAGDELRILVLHQPSKQLIGKATVTLD